jgi:hypothetical protein
MGDATAKLVGTMAKAVPPQKGGLKKCDIRGQAGGRDFPSMQLPPSISFKLMYQSGPIEGNWLWVSFQAQECFRTFFLDSGPRTDTAVRLMALLMPLDVRI